MTEPGPPDRRSTGRGIARRDFEQIIRRAAELASREGDLEERLSEDEVLRIGQEIGLSAQHVQRAMYELPELTTQPKWYDRYFGPSIFSVARAVPVQADPTMRRLQDYLVTREYLQIARRRGHSVAFTPAEDTLSHLARAFMRPGKRHLVSRASRVLMNVQPIANDQSHIRFDVDLSDERSERLRAGMLLGGFGGAALGSLAAAAANSLLPVLGAGPEILAFGGTFVATMAGAISLAAARFKNRVFTAQFELTGLLDRVEHGDSLDPPPAPWRRRLQLRLFGNR